MMLGDADTWPHVPSALCLPTRANTREIACFNPRGTRDQTRGPDGLCERHQHASDRRSSTGEGFGDFGAAYPTAPPMDVMARKGFVPGCVVTYVLSSCTPESM